MRSIGAPGGELVFQEARAPTGEELQGLIEKIIVWLMKRLTRLGYLVEGEIMSYLADLDPDNLLAPNAGLRAAIVPGPPEKPGDDAAHHAHGVPVRMCWARLLKRVFDLEPVMDLYFDT